MLPAVPLVRQSHLPVGFTGGGREDDFIAAGVDFHARGRFLDDEMTLVRHAWQGEPVIDGTTICAAPVQIPVLFRGSTNAAVRRVTQFGPGWVSGATSIEQVDRLADAVL
jgi:alkanesulfonate monooxygenase SsuD/methylene tetrahydromethanopterin reductase-like flavin-dependent oxidoreductase (luciferase family)